MQVFFYEAFAEEEAAIRSFLPAHITAGFSAGTIAETGHDGPPATLISIRTQLPLKLRQRRHRCWAGIRAKGVAKVDKDKLTLELA